MCGYNTFLFSFFIQLTPTASYSEEVVDALQKLGFPLNEELLKWSVSRHIFGPQHKTLGCCQTKDGLKGPDTMLKYYPLKHSPTLLGFSL